jgi:Uri superfamily endonuclease
MKLIDKKTGEEKYVLKLRGITLNHENAKRIQYDKFKEMVTSFGIDDQQVETEIFKIGPDQNSQVMTKFLKKKYTVVNRKGLLSNNLQLYPFGFK